MKLATYEYQGRQSFGVVADDGICDVPSVRPDGPGRVLEALQAGPDALRNIAAAAAEAKDRIATHAVRLLAPLPNPPKVIALAGNYAEHLKESNLAKGLSDTPAIDTTPRPFLMPATAVAAPGADIPWPAYSRDIDYEVELAVVVGSEARCVSPEEARRCIAGYTIANDVSARSVTFAQGRSARPWDEFYDWLSGKWADGFCPMGPWLVTADEIGDPRSLELELTVNGQVRQKANSSQMIFDVYQVLSFLSHLMTLRPGDIISTGTPPGVGMATGNYLSGGDVITCRVENIGELTNTLGEPPTDFYTPCKSGP